MTEPFDVTPDQIVQVVVHGAFFPQLVAWLESQDFRVVEFSRDELEPDSMRTFGMTLGPGRVEMLRGFSRVQLLRPDGRRPGDPRD